MRAAMILAAMGVYNKIVSACAAYVYKARTGVHRYQSAAARLRAQAAFTMNVFVPRVSAVSTVAAAAAAAGRGLWLRFP